MSREEIFEIQAGLCRAMGNSLRMEIVHLLRAHPMSVSEIASATATHQATISRNLSSLRSAGVVVSRREGTNAIYQIANPKLASVCDLMREVLLEQIGAQSRAFGYREK